MADPSVYGIGLESALSLAGVVLLGVGLRRRWGAAGPAGVGRIAPWVGPPSELMLYLMLALAGGIILPIFADLVIRHTTLGPTEAQVWENLAFDCGVLVGVAIFHRVHAPARSPLAMAGVGPVRSGAITFLISLPLVFASLFLWHGVLSGFGFDARDQDVVTLFQDLRAPAMKGLFVVLAVVLAPCAEELIFRAGIFRFLQGRIRRGWAIFVSALLFGAMHLQPSPREGLGSLLPLIVLGAMFAVAYERTGLIATAMVAHAFYNLNTLVMLLLGVAS